MSEAILINVMTKARKQFGKVYPAETTDYQVKVVKNESIEIYRNGQLCRAFKMGEQAEYDSYNLIYTGAIVAIGEKTVTIEDGKRYRLDMNTFCWRNHDFDAADVAAKNADTMTYI